jgi:hypothetical protein
VAKQIGRTEVFSSFSLPESLIDLIVIALSIVLPRAVWGLYMYEIISLN